MAISVTVGSFVHSIVQKKIKVSSYRVGCNRVKRILQNHVQIEISVTASGFIRTFYSSQKIKVSTELYVSEFAGRAGSPVPVSLTAPQTLL